MLFIEDKDRETQWHVGEALPKIDGPVVTFQADGHELDVILAALHGASKWMPHMVAEAEQVKE